MQNLNLNFPIVNPDGTPNEYFMRLLQGRGDGQDDIETTLTTLQETIATKADKTIVLTASTGLTGGGDLSANRSFAIDTSAEAERIRDVIGAALVAGSNITITVNDAGDTITIASSGGGGGASAKVEFVPGSPPTISSSTGITSVTRNAAGRYRITFSSAFANVYYSMAISAQFSVAADDNIPRINVDRRSGFGKTTTTVDITITDSTNVAKDCAWVNIAFFA